MFLKRSTSRNSTAKRSSGLRCWNAIAWLKRSMNSDRLGSPVSASWSASCSSFSSASLRSVTSVCEPAMRVAFPCASRTAVPRKSTQRQVPSACRMRCSTSRFALSPDR